MVAAAEVPSLVPPSIFWWLIPLVVIVAIVGVAIPKPGGHRQERRRSVAGATERRFVAKPRLISDRELEFL